MPKLLIFAPPAGVQPTAYRLGGHALKIMTARSWVIWKACLAAAMMLRFGRYAVPGRLGLAALILVLSGHASPAKADFDPCPGFMRDDSAVTPDAPGEIVFSPYSIHWSHWLEHKASVLLGYDHYLAGGWFCGVSVFTNSFAQPSAYIYAGKIWEHPWNAHPRFFLSLTGGILYGWVGTTRNEVPLNYKGFSPGLILDLGYRLTAKDDLNFYSLGVWGLMFAYSRRF